MKNRASEIVSQERCVMKTECIRDDGRFIKKGSMSPLLFSPPRSDAPWWVLPILTFFSGAAITASVLLPAISTPDYQRGHAAGYTAGWQDGVVKMRAACDTLLIEND